MEGPSKFPLQPQGLVFLFMLPLHFLTPGYMNMTQ